MERFSYAHVHVIVDETNSRPYHEIVHSVCAYKDVELYGDFIS